MDDIGKLPGVRQSWPSKPIKSVLQKKMNDKKDNKNQNSKKSDDEDNDESNNHIDEYA